MTVKVLKVLGNVVAFQLFIFLLSPLSPAQDQWRWPDKPKNLQVLPKDWTGEQLSPVMKGFTRALGVRCSYCHVGIEGQPLTTYDFASDENPNKDRAREMYRMLKDINNHLKKLQPSDDKRVNMWCNTCHRGRPKPTTLAEELGERYRKDNIGAALAYYVELRRNITAEAHMILERMHLTILVMKCWITTTQRVQSRYLS